MTMFVVVLTGGDDLAQVYGPFGTPAEAAVFARTIPTVWEPCITEVEDPETWETE